LKGGHVLQVLFAKCGNNCGRCPSYKENLKTDEDRQRCSDGWEKYLGFRLSPGKLRLCDGCQAPDAENPILYYKNGCTIRRCAVFNGAQTCAHCSVYPCEDLKAFQDVNRKEIEARIRTPIPEEQYLTFIEPYENLKHLDEIRASLGQEDIVEPTKPPPFKPKTVDFPEDLPFSKEETSAFKALHRLVRTINTVDADTYAMQERLKKRRHYFLKLLWTFGLWGELKEEGGLHLVLDGDIYLEQKLAGRYSTVVDHHFKTLEGYGVHCEHIALGEGWLLPSGWLRRRGKGWDKGWLMKMAFDDNAGGVSALEALKVYTAKLNEKYGKRAFRYFSKADMRVLGDEQSA